MLKKILFITGGTLSLGLGILGIVLPGLPTTPFMLLTAYLYASSSERLSNWLMNHRFFGKIIKDYKENPGLTVIQKILICCMAWIMCGIAIFRLWDNTVAVILLTIAGLSCVWAQIFFVPTRKKSNKS